MSNIIAFRLVIFEIRNYWIYLTFENQHLLDRVMVPWDLSRTAPQCPAVREDRERSLDNAPDTALACQSTFIATRLLECRKQIYEVYAVRAVELLSAGPTERVPAQLTSLGCS